MKSWIDLIDLDLILEEISSDLYGYVIMKSGRDDELLTQFTK